MILEIKHWGSIIRVQVLDMVVEEALLMPTNIGLVLDHFQDVKHVTYILTNVMVDFKNIYKIFFLSMTSVGY